MTSTRRQFFRNIYKPIIGITLGIFISTTTVIAYNSQNVTNRANKIIETYKKMAPKNATTENLVSYYDFVSKDLKNVIAEVQKGLKNLKDSVNSNICDIGFTMNPDANGTNICSIITTPILNCADTSKANIWYKAHLKRCGEDNGLKFWNDKIKNGNITDIENEFKKFIPTDNKGKLCPVKGSKYLVNTSLCIPEKVNITSSTKNTGTYGNYGRGGVTVPPVTTVCIGGEFPAADGCLKYFSTPEQREAILFQDQSWSYGGITPRRFDDYFVMFLNRHMKIADWNNAFAQNDSGRSISILEDLEKYIKNTAEYRTIHPDYSVENAWGQNNVNGRSERLIRLIYNGSPLSSSLDERGRYDTGRIRCGDALLECPRYFKGELKITALPEPGYKFFGWQSNGECVGTNPVCIIKDTYRQSEQGWNQEWDSYGAIAIFDIEDSNTKLCTSFTYGSWSRCQFADISAGPEKQRKILSSSPFGCVGGNPVTRVSCKSEYVAPVQKPCTGTHPTETDELTLHSHKLDYDLMGFVSTAYPASESAYQPRVISNTTWKYFDWSKYGMERDLSCVWVLNCRTGRVPNSGKTGCVDFAN